MMNKHEPLVSPYVLPHETVYPCERLGEQYIRLVHPSGLTVLLCPKQMHTLSAALVVRYGARDGRFACGDRAAHRYPEGVAHYLEHQTFTREDGASVDGAFAALGVDVNAWTNYEKTAYILNAPTHAEQALELLLRFVLTPAFTEASVEKERGIIEQEIRMIEDDPWEALHRQTMRCLYPHHYITRGVCGSVRSIASITPKTLYDCHGAFYRPENMYLCVCGDMTRERLVKILDGVMPTICPRSGDAARSCVSGAYHHRMPMRALCRSYGNVSKPIFSIVWRDDTAPCEPFAREAYAARMDVLSELLFSRAGAFYNRLLEKELITNAYSYGATITEDVAYHEISGESDDPEAVYRLYWETLQQARREHFTAVDFERNRRVCYATFIADFDDTEEIADLLVAAEGDGVGAFDRLAVIDTLTLSEIDALFDASFDRKHTALSVLLPQEHSAMIKGDTTL